MLENIQFTPDRKLTQSLSIIVAIAAIVAAIGIVLVPGRIWPNILLASYYLLGLGLAGAMLLAFAALSNAGWLAAIRRVPEAVASNVYVGGLLMIITLIGTHHLYEWSHTEVVAADPILRSKSAWLNVPFFSLRTFIYVSLWSGLIWMMLRLARREGMNGDLGVYEKEKKLAGVFIVVMALTFWLASMDWIMSIEPHWFSTIFGIYHFSGIFLTGIAAIAIVVIILKRMGPLAKVVREDHLHDLGKLLFAFSTFWMYIWFSQYILIWYANIPEETSYFIRRETAGWGTFMILNLLFNWVIPFVFLLPKAAKRNEGLLLKVSIAVMIGHWIDLFWMILPPFMPETPNVHVWEVAPLAGAIALFFLITFRALSKTGLVPTRDPMLVESLHYHA